MKMILAQRQRPRHLRHIDLAAHCQPDLAVLGVEDRKFIAGDTLAFPPFAAGRGPGSVWMGAPVLHRASVRIGHVDQVMRGAVGAGDRRNRAVDNMHAVGGGTGDERLGVSDVLAGLFDRIGDRLHNGNAECHVLLQRACGVWSQA
jgi:hypothetical protein